MRRRGSQGKSASDDLQVAQDACTRDEGDVLALLASTKIHQAPMLSFRIQTNQVHRTLLHHCIVKPSSRRSRGDSQLNTAPCMSDSDSCPRCLE